MTGIAPTDVAALLREAELALRQNRSADAAVCLRRALDVAPADGRVASVVRRVAGIAQGLLTSGRAAIAASLLLPLAGSAHARGPVLMLAGYALVALQRPDAAERILRRWAAQEPANRDAALRLAAVLADNDKPEEAEVLARRVLARNGADADAAFVLGRALLGRARFDAAEAAFRKAVAAASGHVLARINLMELVWMRSGNLAEAGKVIEDALVAAPDTVELRIAKARLLVAAGDARAALATLDAGLARAPRDAQLLASAASVALDFDAASSLAYSRRLQAVVPDAAAAQVAVGNALLASGNARDALALAADLARTHRADGAAVAMQADALRMLGDPRYRRLLDYRNLVRTEMIDVPSGWRSRDAYVADLISALSRMHTLRAHPLDNSLRGGSQVQLLPEQTDAAAIRAFPAAIDGPIRRYMAALGPGDDPMRRRNTGAYAISGMWSVSLRTQGFHADHYHPRGWIASACYLRVPPAVRRGGGAGWLKFGEPAFPTRPAMGAEYFVQPEPGLLALFPAYMWHGTVPFDGSSNDSRITIAFDVVPA